MSEELEKALLHEVEVRTERRMREFPRSVDLCDERKFLKMGNPDEFHDPDFETIMELIRKIRELDGLTDNIVHPLIDEIIKGEDHCLKMQATRLNKLLEETSERHSKGLPPPFDIPNIYAFTIQDRKGRMHLFNSDAQSLTQLTSAIKIQLGDEVDENNPPRILVNEGKTVNASDSDLIEAVNYARSAGRKVLKLHLDYSSTSMNHVEPVQDKVVASTDHVQPSVRANSAVVLGGASAVGLCMLLVFVWKFRKFRKFRSTKI